jgi:hypothetical protein
MFGVSKAGFKLRLGVGYQLQVPVEQEFFCFSWA